MKVKVSRKEHFNAAHRLYNPEWSDQENERVFGKCSNPNFHGHNYELVVSLIGEPDPATGYVYDMKRLSDLIRRNVIQNLDHKNLNLTRNTSGTSIPRLKILLSLSGESCGNT